MWTATCTPPSSPARERCSRPWRPPKTSSQCPYGHAGERTRACCSTACSTSCAQQQHPSSHDEHERTPQLVFLLGRTRPASWPLAGAFMPTNACVCATSGATTQSTGCAAAPRAWTCCASCPGPPGRTGCHTRAIAFWACAPLCRSTRKSRSLSTPGTPAAGSGPRCLGKVLSRASCAVPHAVSTAMGCRVTNH